MSNKFLWHGLGLALAAGVLTACGGGGGSSSPASPTPVASAPTPTTAPTPAVEPILAEETSTATVSPDAPKEFSDPVDTTIATPAAPLSSSVAPAGSSLSSTELSRPIHLSEFGIDLTQFANKDKAYVSVFVAASDWVGESTSESRQFLLTNLTTALNLDSQNLIRANLPLAVTHISITVFDRSSTITARVAL